ncbi:hypothetical protein P43SY_009232 [Pythium insidiosum]|uniref:Wings apart-like protein C-terminal domain-containing protein n=1 Tax=Pythium insidiosum TaxID=114742 RepID=A0AAD5LLM9_PYTIN|nr:hypothetical protein P43SY_009232 [Pythium insidiosum]
MASSSSSSSSLSSSAVDAEKKESDGAPQTLSDERGAAFEAARQRFAMYGRQNAHVSHYVSPSRQPPSSDSRKPTTAAADPARASPHAARRAVRFPDERADTPSAVQNTLLLQENGELALRLDDMEYHLDGVLATAAASVPATDERLLATAQSVVALARVCREDGVLQAAMKLSGATQSPVQRLRQALRLLELGPGAAAAWQAVRADDPLEDREMRPCGLLRLALAVLALTLALSAEADEVLDAGTLDLLVATLPQPPPAVPSSSSSSSFSSGAPTPTPSTERAPRSAPADAKRKTFLKRKKSGGATGADSDQPSSAAESAAVAAVGLGAASHGSRSEELRRELLELVAAGDVDAPPFLSLADVVATTLRQLLVVDSGDRSHTRFGRGVSLPHHRGHDLASATFALIRARKHQLLANGGVDTLLSLLERRLARLQAALTATVDAALSPDAELALQRVRTVLLVLDHASFLAKDVQRHMSQSDAVFRQLLALIETLSSLAWSASWRTRWRRDADPQQRLHLVVDVLLATLRVLINLSHHNADAARYLAQLHGARVLFVAFCQLWAFVEPIAGKQQELDTPTAMEERLVYDSYLLLLSAITNCVEHSPENRLALSDLDLSALACDHGLDVFRSSSVCGLLVSFFLSRVTSYVRLIELSESQDLSSAALESESWVPEDVILGGCTSLLLGCLMTDSSYHSAIILGALPDNSPRLLLRALGAFVALHSQIGALTPEVGQSVLQVEKLFNSFLYQGDVQVTTRDGAVVDTASVLAGWEGGDGAQSGSVSSSATTSLSLSLPAEERHSHDALDSSEPTDTATSAAHRSPPASAFKRRQFSRVCSSVDDSDVDSDTPEQQVSASASASPSDMAISGSMKLTTRAGSLTVAVTVTPKRSRATEKALSSRTKSSSIRRLKRTRQFVTDLEAEFMKIGSRVSQEIQAAITSREDGAVEPDEVTAKLDFSQDIFEISTPKRRRPAATPRIKKSPVASQSSPVPPLTHKRKLKPTPEKNAPAQKGKATPGDATAVFDFPE